MDGHFGTKTLELVTQSLLWPYLQNYPINYVYTCARVVEHKCLNIILMVYYNHYSFQRNHGNLSPWILSQIFNLKRLWHYLNCGQSIHQDGTFFTIYTKSINSNETSDLVMHKVFQHHISDQDQMQFI